MRPFAQWSAIVVAATTVDLAVRFAMPFDLERVLRVEALLFPSTGLLLLWLMQRQQTPAVAVVVCNGC